MVWVHKWYNVRILLVASMWWWYLAYCSAFFGWIQALECQARCPDAIVTFYAIVFCFSFALKSGLDVQDMVSDINLVFYHPCLILYKPSTVPSVTLAMLLSVHKFLSQSPIESLFNFSGQLKISPFPQNFFYTCCGFSSSSPRHSLPESSSLFILWANTIASVKTM